MLSRFLFIFLSTFLSFFFFFFFFFLMIRRPPRSTLFPYRRSSDLTTCAAAQSLRSQSMTFGARPLPRHDRPAGDRKSTRLNSSHGYISYAVFCLKKKKKKNRHITMNEVTKIVKTHSTTWRVECQTS